MFSLGGAGACVCFGARTLPLLLPVRLFSPISLFLVVVDAALASISFPKMLPRPQAAFWYSTRMEDPDVVACMQLLPQNLEIVRLSVFQVAIPESGACTGPMQVQGGSGVRVGALIGREDG